MQSVFTDWITIDLNEIDARCGSAAGAPAGDGAQEANRLSAAIVNGLDKWFAAGKVAVGMLCAYCLPHCSRFCFGWLRNQSRGSILGCFPPIMSALSRASFASCAGSV
jgi:hypothetical protein